jgi:carbon monoxide dehydrogenase subunit G
MILEGRCSMAARPEDLWAILDDPHRLAEIVPTLADPESAGNGALVVVARPGTGLGLAPFPVRLHVVEQRAPEWAVIRGVGASAQHAVDLTVTVRLVECGPSTRVEWRADLRLAGVLASVGQRVVPALVRSEVEHALHRIGRAVADGQVG